MLLLNSYICAEVRKCVYKLEFVLKNSKTVFTDKGKTYTHSVKQKFEVDAFDYMITQYVMSEKATNSVEQRFQVTIIATSPFKVKVASITSDSRNKTKYIHKETLPGIDEFSPGPVFHILGAE